MKTECHRITTIDGTYLLKLSFSFPGSYRLIPIFFLVLTLGFCLSLMQGRYPVSLWDIREMMWCAFSGTPLPPDLAAKQMVFLWIRLPRCLMAVLVGAGLSASGAVYQALFRNPLVSPDILGVAAGCTFGAALGIILAHGQVIWIQFFSFTAGVAAVFMTLGIARLIAVRPLLVMILSGMVVMSFFNALLMLLKYFADPYDELPGIVFWIMGSLSRVTWQDVFTTMPVVAAGLLIMLVFRFQLNILSMGDTRAGSLGLNPLLLRVVLILISALMVAMLVAVCGQISWIGLIIPHMARTLAGPRHEKMLPLTALMGALFMLAADGAARALTSAELPVGIITALTGAPLFGFLLYRNRGSGWI